MSVITFFGRQYTGREILAQRASEVLGYRVMSDRDLIKSSAEAFGLEEKDIRKSIYKDPPFDSRYTPGKAQCIAAVKSVLAREVKKGNIIFSGFLGKLIPPEIGLSILVTASENFRWRQIQKQGVRKKTQLMDMMSGADESFLRWSLYLRTSESRRPTDCDGVVNVSKTGQAELIELISQAAADKKEEMDPRALSLAAKVSRLMAQKGHPVSVAAKDHRVDLVIHKPVLMMERYGRKLSDLARSVAGVEQVKTRAGRLFYKADIYRGCDFSPTLQVSCKPIAMQYEQLYAQVADRRRPFVQKQPHDIPTLAWAQRA